jgi:hypothetical protein
VLNHDLASLLVLQHASWNYLPYNLSSFSALHSCFSFTQSQPYRGPLPLRPCCDFTHISGSSPYILRELVDKRHVKNTYLFLLFPLSLSIMPPRRSHKKSRAGCRRCKNRKIKVGLVDPLLMPQRIAPLRVCRSDMNILRIGLHRPQTVCRSGRLD